MKINKFQATTIKNKTAKIAIVKSRFNQEITDNLCNGALKALEEAGVKKTNIKIVEVPGSFEVPIMCQKLLLKQKLDGLIAIGAVIKGETAHFDYISTAATNGIMQVMLNRNTPISFGIITTYNLRQAKARSGKNKNNKGREAALALVETLNKCAAL